ncbi:hypothetical protein [Staphylococcus equorum]|uniref:hypothetical protein n=1 Tax=Staphylococcus equorum TaxID=246432 RepID=UPI003F5614B7
MKKGIIIMTSIVWLVLIYIAQIVAHILTTLSETSDKAKIFNDASILYLPPAKHPISTIIEFISDKNMIFIVLAIVVTVFALYILGKQLMETKDGNEKNQDYKIAKHGSHGSAKFATADELFNGYYKKMREEEVTDYVYKSLDTSKIKGRSDNQ